MSLHRLLQVEHGGEDLWELLLDDAEAVLEDGGRDEVGEALHRPDDELALGEGRPHLGIGNFASELYDMKNFSNQESLFKTHLLPVSGKKGQIWQFPGC